MAAIQAFMISYVATLASSRDAPLTTVLLLHKTDASSFESRRPQFLCTVLVIVYVSVCPPLNAGSQDARTEGKSAAEIPSLERLLQVLALTRRPEHQPADSDQTGLSQQG